ncbi:MAG: DUF6132 family protein [Chlorobi bacterium]|nr:DUF6132 family protein [Chlorobiota bacterium]MCI0715188.1 DUF6132 family protein [Chlorobiota bacterium]
MNKYLKLLLFIIAGAGAGYAYYYYIGCTSGSCPLTSNWYVTTFYGAFSGLLLGFPAKDKKKE